jgi:hypothetical protein
MAGTEEDITGSERAATHRERGRISNIHHIYARPLAAGAIYGTTTPVYSLLERLTTISLPRLKPAARAKFLAGPRLTSAAAAQVCAHSGASTPISDT